MKLRGRYNTDEQLAEFAVQLVEFSKTINFKVSSRGWAYLMEGERMINKDQFDKVTNLINTCRKKGLLPIDFVAEQAARAFTNILTPYDGTVVDRFSDYLYWSLRVDNFMELDWWRNEEYYIQMVVEKVDLVTLFLPVCKKYKIPIANSAGWSSILQRAEYARRFKEAKDKGLKCVLLYCGDHDPDGLRISEFLRSNLEDLNRIYWADGQQGYDPSDLIIDRFGLNYDFIQKYGLTWIDNLITGSGGAIATLDAEGNIQPGRTKGGKIHPNYSMEYAQRYLRDVGVRKCEANAIVTIPEAAARLCEEAIIKYLGDDALERFELVREQTQKEFEEFKKKKSIVPKINVIRNIADNYEIPEDNE